MRVATAVLTASAGLLWAAAAPAASSQPPMGEFLGAFYACDQGQAFQISYDSKSPKTATITTSNNNHRYQLKRSGDGSQFTNGSVSVSVAGDTAEVRGTALKLSECKLKSTS